MDNQKSANSRSDKQVIDLTIRLFAIFLLLLWCFSIIEPFLLIIAWGAIVAIALHPFFCRVSKRLDGRTGLTALLFTLCLISIVVVPAVMLTESLIGGIEALVEAGEAGRLHFPLPPDAVAQWPLVGEELYDLWQRVARNPPELIKKMAPQLHALGNWLLKTITGTGLGVLQFVISFIVAGVLLANAPRGARAAEAFATRLAGARGREFATLSSTTIANVAIGIVGVSILQSVLLGMGFIAMDLPGAGLLAVIVLVLCIVQMGPTLVALPAIAYVFYTADTTPAILFTVWTLVISFADGILKPIVFSRGATVPTLVIFLGAIGGMIAAGIIGLFVGAVVLSLGYELYTTWLSETPEYEQSQAGPLEEASKGREV